MSAIITAVGETARVRHPDPSRTTAKFLWEAAQSALKEAGLAPGAIDGLAVASFTLEPDRAIDLA
jgi:3-oxoacyl-[acyl-carrier-protein] synthase III